jgi:phosphate transport system protein
MRTVYHEKLSELSEQLGRMCGLAGAAMERATRALMQADLTSADQDQIMAMTKGRTERHCVCAGATAPRTGRATCSAIWPPTRCRCG